MNSLCGYFFMVVQNYDWVWNVTLEHKTSHKGQFWEIEIYTSSESWINHISIDLWFGQYLKIWNLRMQKNLNIEKIIFKVVLSNAYY